MMKKGEEKEADPRGKAAPERWRGDAVEPQPGDEAEHAADRAEGNTPVRADFEREREKIQEPPDPNQQPLRVGRPARDTDNPDEEIEEAAEQHRERRDAGERPPRGKL